MKLIADKLSVNRGEREIFRDLSFTLGQGRSLVVTGPNGSGKSTLLKTLAGFLRPRAGEIRLEGGGEGAIGEHCHYLAHDNALKAVLTVRENLEFWQQFLGKGLEIDAALGQIGLGEMSDIPAGFLSAGQKRRAAIARLLVSRRPIWLVDEPTAALDKASEQRFVEIANDYLAGGGVVIAATHQVLGLEDPVVLDIAAFAGAGGQ